MYNRWPILGSLVFTKVGCPSKHVEVVISVVSVPISLYACLSPPPKWATTKETSNALFHADIYIGKKGISRCMVILVCWLIYYLFLQNSPL